MSRILSIVLVCCSGSSPLHGMMGMQMVRASMPPPRKLSMPGYFFISESVSEALLKGNRAERLAHNILHDIWVDKINASDVLKMRMSFASRMRMWLAGTIYDEKRIRGETGITLNDLNNIAQGKRTPNISHAAHENIVKLVEQELSDEEQRRLRKELGIEKIFQVYRQGLAKGLLPPLPRSVTYTFAHLDSVFQQEAQQLNKSWYAKLTSIHEHDLVARKTVDKILIPAVIFTNQTKFFLSGEDAMRRTIDGNDPYRVFDDVGNIKDIEPLSIFDVANKLNMSPEHVLQFTTDISNSVQTEWGIFPLYFFLNDIVKPEYAEWQQIKQEIIDKLDNIPKHEWPRSARYDEEIAEELQSRGIRVTTRKVAKIRTNHFGTTVINELLKAEEPLHPLSSQAIANLLLEKADIRIPVTAVNTYLRNSGIPTAQERKREEIKRIIYEVLDESPMTNQELVQLLYEKGVRTTRVTMDKYLQQ